MDRYYRRLFQEPKRSFFLFGPRGTGKSTVLRKRYPDALWIDLLDEDVFRRLSAHPKFYYFDSGVFNTLMPKGPFDLPNELQGAAVEGLILQHLRAWNEYSGDQHSIHFWRTSSGVEVDFILYGPTGLIAIEVKSGREIHPKDTRGLTEFGRDYPMAK